MNPLKTYTASIVFITFASLVGCGPEQSGPPPGPPPAAKVTVAKPVVMPIVEWDEYTGRLDAINSVEVRARVNGYLESTHFVDGQAVRRGDLLAIIDPRPFEAELNASKAREKEASAKLAESKAVKKQAEAERADAQISAPEHRSSTPTSIVRKFG